MMDVLINLIVVIISQCMHTSNHHEVQFKCIRFLKLHLDKTQNKRNIWYIQFHLSEKRREKPELTEKILY